jgi:menaquinone-dependent protoporphyrinogen IX oxidase
MKKTTVVYSSISGFTKKYAEWIAADLAAKAIPLKNFDSQAAACNDIIVYGGSLYAGGIRGLKKFKKKVQTLGNKTIVIFACGASPDRPDTLEDVLKHNFTEKEKTRYPFFYLRGGFDFKKLDPFNKILMALMKWVLSTKKTRTEDEEGMLAAYDHPADFTQREYIAKLVDFCKSKG